MLVQAFQHTETTQREAPADTDMAMISSSAADTHITLKRPHTVILQATLRGGYAKRGAYSNAIAEQFKQADGKTDVYKMHSGAVLSMRLKYGEDQIFQTTSTVKGKLLHPRSQSFMVGTSSNSSARLQHENADQNALQQTLLTTYSNILCFCHMRKVGNNLRGLCRRGLLFEL